VNTVDNLSSDLSKERASWGRKLFITAWVVEIMAAFIGLMIAWFQGYEAYLFYKAKNDGIFPTIHSFDIIIAALPFIMVAVVELLKIPLAFLVFTNRRTLIKAIYLIVLAGVTVITFETMFLGFERQYTNITAKVRVPQQELANIEDRISTQVSQIQELELNTQDYVNVQVSSMRKTAEDVLYSALENLENQKLELVSSKNSSLMDKISLLENNKERVVEKRNEELNRLDDLLTEAKKEEQDKRKGLIEANNKRINTLIKEREQLKKEIADEKDRLSIFASTSDLEERVAAIGDKIDSIQSGKTDNVVESQLIKQDRQSLALSSKQEISSISNELSKLELELAIQTQELEGINVIDEKIQKVREQYSRSISEIDKKRSMLELALSNKDGQLIIINKEIELLRSNASETRSIIDEAASGSQVYRLAMGWFEKDRAAEVTRNEADTVAMYWFGSLALIVSAMGVVLAFGSYILKHPSVRTSRNSGPLSSSLRLTLRALRKRLREPKIITVTREKEVPVTVVKEVPVDKVVFKEVPVEVTKIEVIHTPIYTNDPDLLKFGTTKVKKILDDE